MSLAKFKKIKKKLKKKEFKSLIDIIKQENNDSILANLSEKNISKFINQVIASRELSLFIVKKYDIIGYAVIAKKPHFLGKVIKLTFVIPPSIICFIIFIKTS